jgi:hypothetical protein
MNNLYDMINDSDLFDDLILRKIILKEAISKIL